MLVLVMAQERHANVDIVFYYQISTAVAAFYDVLTWTGCNQ